jgi:hypothetical protein
MIRLSEDDPKNMLRVMETVQDMTLNPLRFGTQGPCISRADIDMKKCP